MTDHRESIAILLPCFNEELTVGKTVSNFHSQFPNAEIIVCDNASDDRTAEKARETGARVLFEPRRGKGFAVRKLFSEVTADFYILADGDNTYPAEEARKLFALVRSGTADVAIGNRLAGGSYHQSSSRRFHFTGNHLIAYVVTRFFGQKVGDPLSGLRIFSRKFVKSVPLISQGFEIETELTLQAMDKGFVTTELPILYNSRPEENPSKLRTFSDGARIITMFFRFALYFRPLVITLSLSVLSFMAALLLGFAPVMEYFTQQYVYKVPSLIVAVSALMISVLSFFLGFVLESLRYARMENFLLSLRNR